jgi:hypothetical protein
MSSCLSDTHHLTKHHSVPQNAPLLQGLTNCKVWYKISNLDGVLFGWQAEGIPAHGVQHIEAPHALVPSHDVSCSVAFRVTNM